MELLLLASNQMFERERHHGFIENSPCYVPSDSPLSLSDFSEVPSPAPSIQHLSEYQTSHSNSYPHHSLNKSTNHVDIRNQVQMADFNTSSNSTKQHNLMSVASLLNDDTDTVVDQSRFSKHDFPPSQTVPYNPAVTVTAATATTITSATSATITTTTTTTSAVSIPDIPASVSNEFSNTTILPRFHAPTPRITLLNLLQHNLLPAGTQVHFRDNTATVTPRGTLLPSTTNPYSPLPHWLQTEFETPSAWATAVVKSGRVGVKAAVNGWSAVKVRLQSSSDDEGSIIANETSRTRNSKGEASLDFLRKRYLSEIVGVLNPASSLIKDESDPDQIEVEPDHLLGMQPASGVATRKRKRSSVTVTVRRLRSGSSPSLSDETDREINPSKTVSFSKRRRSKPVATADNGELDEEENEEDEEIYGIEEADHHRHRRHRRRRRRGSSPHTSSTKNSRRSPCKRRASSNQSTTLSFSEEFINQSRIPIPLASLDNFRAEINELAAKLGGSAVSEPALKESIIKGTMIIFKKGSAEANEILEKRACFACGGLDDKLNNDDMIGCSKCSETFHKSCVAFNNYTARHEEERGWVCPRCIRCFFCFLTCAESPFSITTDLSENFDRRILTCLKCHLRAHISCALTHDSSVTIDKEAELSSDIFSFWICSSCRSCPECGRANPTSSMASPLCECCDTLQNKGNICPVCRALYQDDDFDTPMVLCDSCDRWIHAHCDDSVKDKEGEYEALGREGSGTWECGPCRQEKRPRTTEGEMINARRGESFLDLLEAVEQIESGGWIGHETEHDTLTKIYDEKTTSAAEALLAFLGGEVVISPASLSPCSRECSYSPLQSASKSEAISDDASATRRCALCAQAGSFSTLKMGYLIPIGPLYMNSNCEHVISSAWAHQDCVLFASGSKKEFENDAARTIRVAADSLNECILLSRLMTCQLCGHLGASVRCSVADCLFISHLPCVLSLPGSKPNFNKATVVCPNHSDMVITSTQRLARRIFVAHEDEKENGIIKGKNDEDDEEIDVDVVGDEHDIVPSTDWPAFPLSSTTKSLDHAFRIGALCITSIGFFPHNSSSDQLDFIVVGSEVLPIPIGFEFVRSFRDWRSIDPNVPNIKVSFAYLLKPEKGIPAGVDVFDNNGVVVRTDRHERIPPPGKFAWRVKILEEVVWVESLVDVVKVLRDEMAGEIRKKSHLICVFEVDLPALCGLDQPRLRAIVRSLDGFGRASSIPTIWKDRIRDRARVLRDLELDGSNKIAETGPITCSRTDGKFKTTRRKIKRIGRCEEAAGWNKYAATSMGAHHVRPSSVVHVAGAVCTMPSSAVLAKYRTMKTLERENTIVRPVYGDRHAGAVSLCSSNSNSNNSSNNNNSNNNNGIIGGHYSDYRYHHPSRGRNSVDHTQIISSSRRSSHLISAPPSVSISLPSSCPTSLTLHTSRSFEKDEMILEYVGEIIGAKVAEKRRRIYASRARACFMMIGGADWIVDASVVGGRGRFIQHARDPACYARVLLVDGHPRVVVCAARHLDADEELTLEFESVGEEMAVCSGPGNF